MQRTTALFIFLLVIISGYSQVNQIGLSLTVDGKIEFSKDEPNYNGYLEDTVYITCDSKTQMVDLRNFKFDHLTILEAPGMGGISPSYGDPSRRADTTSREEYDKQKNPNLSGFVFGIETYVSWDTILPEKTKENKTKTPEPYFQDVIDGLGLNDSITAMLKQKLRYYITRNSGHDAPYDERNNLYKELSVWDSVVDKQPVYDYLVDLLLFYNYTDDKLTSAMGYHWDSGIEFDSLRYDRKGNLIYFSRESISAIRNEFQFEYDKKNRVTIITHTYSSAPSQDMDPNSFIVWHVEVTKYSYGKSGKVESKSTSMEENKWLTCTYKLN